MILEKYLIHYQDSNFSSQFSPQASTITIVLRIHTFGMLSNNFNFIWAFKKL